MRLFTSSGARRRAASSVAALVLLVPLDAPAQTRRASLHGVVRDSAGTPLSGAEVELFGSPRRKMLTSAEGTFRFDGLYNSRYWLVVRRIGYRPAQQSLTLSNNERREVAVSLEAAPYQLPEVVVEAERSLYRRRMQEFLWRSRSSFRGRFLTRDDIARARPGMLGDLVIRYLPFKQLSTMSQPGGFIPLFDSEDWYSTTRLAVRTHYRPDCPPAIALNGSGITPGFAVNDFAPEEIEALEVYREGASLPVEYAWLRQSECGLVVLWLKSYARAAP